MKKLTIGFVILNIALFFTGCSNNLSSVDTFKTGTINISISSEFSRTIYPDGLSLEVETYTISGSGPEGATISSDVTSTAKTYTDLAVGEWLFTVNATNASDTIIGTGSLTHTIVAGETNSIVIAVNQVSGTGTLDITVKFPEGEIYQPKIEGTLTNIEDQTTQSITFTTGDNSGTYTNTAIPTGIYDLSIKLNSGDLECWGTYETTLIFDANTSSNTFDLDLSDLITTSKPDISYVNDNQFNITWDELHGYTGYNLYRSSIESGTYTKLNISELTTTSYSDTTITATDKYWYKIAFIKDGVEGVYSVPSVNTLIFKYSLTSTKSFVNNEITINWNAATLSDGYNIYRSTTEGGSYTKLNSSTMSNTSYTDSTISRFTDHYYYRVDSIETGVGIISSTVLHVEYNYPWNSGTTMPTVKSKFSSAALSDDIFVFGGSSATSTVQKYDTLSDSWSTVSDMTDSNYDTVAETLDSKIYVIGGYSSGYSKLVREYTPATDSWTTKSSMPTARYGSCSVVLNNLIYVIGGRNGSYLKSVEVYDPVTDSWATMSSTQASRYRSSAEVIDGKIYVIGGYSNITSVEMYDPSTDTWVYKHSLPSSRYGGATTVYDNEIYYMGGYSNKSDVLKYNPISDTWLEVSSMLSGVDYFTSEIVNNKIYTIADTGTDIYDPLLED
jgi:N-acetylneuraminic acid mutarotase